VELWLWCWDLRLEIAGSIQAASLSNATLVHTHCLCYHALEYGFIASLAVNSHAMRHTGPGVHGLAAFRRHFKTLLSVSLTTQLQMCPDSYHKLALCKSFRPNYLSLQFCFILAVDAYSVYCRMHRVCLHRHVWTTRQTSMISQLLPKR